MIRYITNNEIDRKKWDACIDQSPAERIYARSWFLDAVCPNWEALVEDDYNSVMPLPVRQKWGIRYTFCPTYAQQLGVFNRHEALVSADKFIEHLPKSLKHITLNLNDGNTINNNTTHSILNNYTLSTENSFDELLSAFSSNTKRNIKKANSLQLVLDKLVSKEEFLAFKQDTIKGNSTKSSLVLLERLIDASIKENIVQIWAIRNKSGKIIAALFWLQNKNRAYYLSPSSSEEGKESRAMFLLVDRLVESMAGTKKILDFEGSNIESIAQFFKGFGATCSPYIQIKINRLPWPLNRIKP